MTHEEECIKMLYELSEIELLTELANYAFSDENDTLSVLATRLLEFYNERNYVKL